MKEAFDLIRKRMKEMTEFLSDCTKYGNKDAKQQEKSYSTMYMYEIADMVEDLIEIVSEVEAECGNGWVPCSERLPENDDDVLCWYEYSMLQGVNVVRKAKMHGIGHYYKPTDSWLIYGSFGMGWNVIAWQPLPEPWNPEKGE